MDENKLKALAAERAKGLKTEAALNPFSRMLTKLTVETANILTSLLMWVESGRLQLRKKLGKPCVARISVTSPDIS
ncbi:hypothetical protein ABJ851_002989 [Shigella flexneri]